MNLKNTWPKMVVLLSIALAAMLLLPASLAPAAPATSSTNTPSLAGPNVIDYELMTVNGRRVYRQYEFLESKRVVREGRHLPEGGCEFAGETRLEQIRSVTEIELAYDPATCRSLVEVGTLAPHEEELLSQAAGEDMAADESQEAVTGSSSGGMLSIATHARYHAYSWSWYDEPARWVRGCDVEEECALPPVNTVKNYVKWTPNGTCAIAPGTTGVVGYEHTWLNETGWSRKSHDWNRTPDGACRNSIYSESIVHFQNDLFCRLVSPLFGSSTHTYYEPNRVRGYADGSATFRWKLRKEGPCSVLLRSGHKHDRERI